MGAFLLSAKAQNPPSRLLQNRVIFAGTIFGHG
jgi:hypothetical protein